MQLIVKSVSYTLSKLLGILVLSHDLQLVLTTDASQVLALVDSRKAPHVLVAVDQEQHGPSWRSIHAAQVHAPCTCKGAQHTVTFIP